MPPEEFLDPGFEIQLYMTGFFSMLVVALIIGMICWAIFLLVSIFKKLAGR